MNVCVAVTGEMLFTWLSAVGNFYRKVLYLITGLKWIFNMLQSLSLWVSFSLPKSINVGDLFKT